MTVQELIDKLTTIEDKTMQVASVVEEDGGMAWGIEIIKTEEDFPYMKGHNPTDTYPVLVIMASL